MGDALGGLICLVILFIGFGLLQLFARDFMWDLTHWNNQVAGRASERTETWDAWQVISGVISLLIGVGVACWGFSANAEVNARYAASTAVAVTRVAEQANVAQQLDEEFASAITEMQERATTTAQTGYAPDFGVDIGRSTEIIYGLCDDERRAFYLFIDNYRGQYNSYSYSPEGQLGCRPDYVYYSDRTEIGESRLGGTWYELDFFSASFDVATSVFSNIATSVPTNAITASPRPTRVREDGR